MTGNQENRRHLISWSGSLLIHTVVLILGLSLLIHSAHVNVKTGKTSTEIELTIESAPQAKTYLPPKLPTTQPVLKSEPNRPTHLPTPHSITSTAPSDPAKGTTEALTDDLVNEPPTYPEESRQAHEEGLVILRVEVAESGEPVSVSILHSSGYFRLDQAARRAVQHWKFHPATASGIPIHSEVDTPVRFKLQ
jgi:protein TonB